MLTIEQIYNFLDETMPFSTQESWDNSGITINTNKVCSKILISLDITNDVVEYAIKNNIDLIISHHPIIFKAIKSLNNNDIVYKLIKNEIGVISVHTNYDVYEYGTSYILAKTLNFADYKSTMPFGGIVTLQNEININELVTVCKSKFANLQVSKQDTPIKNIFILAGSASGIVDEVVNSNCQCLICGETRYHDALDLKNASISCITLSHDESENISLEPLADLIKNKFETLDIISYKQDVVLSNY